MADDTDGSMGLADDVQQSSETELFQNGTLELPETDSQ